MSGRIIRKVFPEFPAMTMLRVSKMQYRDQTREEHRLGQNLSKTLPLEF